MFTKMLNIVKNKNSFCFLTTCKPVFTLFIKNFTYKKGSYFLKLPSITSSKSIR